MKKLIFLSLLMLTALSMSAQASGRSEDAKTIELRQKIGIDYSMPDFNTSSINGKVIGDRLAKMLQKLQAEALDYIWSGRIVSVCCEQIEGLQYANLEKFKIKNISKSGDVITIKANVKLGKNSTGIRKTDILMVFDKGVSGSQTINDLFADLRRYIKE